MSGEQQNKLTELFGIFDAVDESTYDFELSIYDYLDKYSLNADTLIKELNNIINTESDIKRIYGAFYMLVTHYRHKKKYIEAFKLVESNKDNFKCNKSFPHIKLIVDIENKQQNYSLQLNSDKIYSQDILIKAKQNLDSLPDHNGVEHMYSKVVSLYYFDNAKSLTSYDIKRISDAIEIVNRAIDKNKNFPPQFYATRARLHLLISDIDNALLDINAALAKLYPHSANYTQRNAEFVVLQTEILLQKESNKARAELESLKESQLKIIEIIGLFSSIIAFILINVNVISHVESTKDILILMFSFTGVLLITFSTFFILLNGFKKNRKLAYIITLLIGIMLIIFASMTKGRLF